MRNGQQQNCGDEQWKIAGQLVTTLAMHVDKLSQLVLVRLVW
jgi:hypothetical protein